MVFRKPWILCVVLAYASAIRPALAIDENDIRLWMINKTPLQGINASNLSVKKLSKKGSYNLGIFEVTTSNGTSKTSYIVKATQASGNSGCYEFKRLEELNAILPSAQTRDTFKFAKLLAWTETISQGEKVCLGLLEKAPGASFFSVAPSQVVQAYRDLGKKLGRLHAIHNLSHGDLHFDNVFYDADTACTTLLDYSSLGTFISDTQEILNVENHGDFKFLPLDAESQLTSGASEMFYTSQVKASLRKAYSMKYLDITKKWNKSFSSEDVNTIGKVLQEFKFDRSRLNQEDLETIDYFSESYMNVFAFLEAYSDQWPTKPKHVDSLKRALSKACESFIDGIIGNLMDGIPSRLDKSQTRNLMKPQLFQVYPALGTCIKLPDKPQPSEGPTLGSPKTPQ